MASWGFMSQLLLTVSAVAGAVTVLEPQVFVPSGEIHHIELADTSEGGKIPVAESSSKMLIAGLRKCVPPYQQVLNQCYYVHVAHRLSWWDARKFCSELGGDLAQPPSVPPLLALLTQDERVGHHQHFWLGASDLVEEGTFRWISGQEVTRGWYQGQPDDEGEGEDCLELWPAKYPSLNDRDCSHQHAFICQY